MEIEQEQDQSFTYLFNSMSNISISGGKANRFETDADAASGLDENTASPATTTRRCGVDGEDAGENEVYFNPSVCLQRYNRVREVLVEHLTNSTETTPATIIEYGCAELRFHQHLKNMSDKVQRLIYVDKDDITLDSVKQRIRPLAYEYLRKRETPLKVEVYTGCVTQCDPQILNMEPPLFAIVGIEIVEHLDQDVLRGFERTVFGLLRPPLVVVTTPNSDFNVVFKLEPGKFRHWDHRFEWSRAEFIQWCDSICSLYGGYTYKVSGIGAGGPDTTHLGCVSQMAVFEKVDDVQMPRDYSEFKDIIIPGCYKEKANEDYPFFVDTTPRDEQIVNGFRCHIANYILTYSSIQDYRYDEKTEITVPIDIVRYITGVPRDVEDLEEVRLALIKGGYNLQMNPVTFGWEIVLKIPEEDDSNFSGDEEMDSEDNTAGVTVANASADSLDPNPDWDSEEW